MARRKTIKGVNDLKSWCLANGDFGKQLINEWTGELENGEHINIDEVSYGSHKKVKWKCSKGHKWLAIIDSRTHGASCPYCYGNIVSNINDLKSWCISHGNLGKQLISEWTGELENGEHINMDEISFGSKKKVKWKCSKCHEWYATICHRTHNKNGCPYCSGNSVSDANCLQLWCLSNGEFGKQLINEWTGELENGEHIEIYKISYGSHKKVKWKCLKGHEWLADVHSRTNGRGCPYCYNNCHSEIARKATLKTGVNDFMAWCINNNEYGKQLISEWTGELENGEHINMDEISYGSNKKIKWKCSKGHEWYATIYHRTVCRRGCPYCSTYGTSYPEQFIYHSLKQLYPDAKSRAKAYIPENTNGIEYDISIISANLCIEYSPTYWHESRAERDNYKKDISKQYNFRLIQIVEDSYNELEHKFEPNYICFKMNEQLKDEILIQIVDYILKTLGHSISEIDIELVKQKAYESSKGVV